MIITIKEARKILGRSYAKRSDEDIAWLINSLDTIAQEFIKSVPKY